MASPPLPQRRPSNSPPAAYGLGSGVAPAPIRNQFAIGALPWCGRAPGLRRRFAGLAVSRPTLLRVFSYGSQTGRREFPLLRPRRLGLLLFLRRPSCPLCGGDPGAASLAYRAALLWTRVIRSGCRGLWPAWTALTELRFDIGYLRLDPFELVPITND